MELTYPPQEINVEKRDDGTLILSSPIKLETPERNIWSKFKQTCNLYPDTIWLGKGTVKNGEQLLIMKL